MKKIEEMSDRELLEELVREKRFNDVAQWIAVGLVVALLVFIYIQIGKYAPLFSDLINRANQLMSDLENTSSQVNELVASVNDGSIEKLKNIIDQLNDGSIDKLKELIENLSSIMSLFKR